MSETIAKQKFGFQAEVKQLLHLMIHSLYSKKEIFLRELISNSSDAVDKLSFEALKDSSLLENDPELKVWIDLDKAARTITIRDNGIGMSREELITNLGTIAKSGTKEFFKNLTGDNSKDANLIGQFGVGFYSSFIVAEKVEVSSRRAGQAPSTGTKWTSAGEGEYELENVELDQRGTTIVLHLRKDEDEFLNDWQLRSIVTRYSDHVSLPVVMKKEEPQDDIDGVKQAPLISEEVVNKASALWTLPKSKISEEQYKEFYKHIAHDYEDPLAWIHAKVEGKLEYNTILYMPSKAPFDLWNANKSRGLKLYVNRVFILDEVEQFLPSYLRFVRGIIDANNLSLNVSRETLQGNKVIDSIRAALTKRVLQMLEQMVKNEPDKYQKFWQEFGLVIKEGPAEDFSNKEQIAKLLRFASSHQDSDQQTVSLEDYVKRMQADQKKIYYVAAETYNAANNSPHLEVFRKKNIEVLIMSDRVDEWLMSHMTEFDSKAFQSVAKGGLDLPESSDKESEDAKKESNTQYESLISQVKDLLKDQVKDVRLTDRLTESPSCLVVDENDMTNQMERLLRSAGQKVPTRKPILELNPEHKMVKHLIAEQDTGKLKDWASILLDQAILAEGGQLENPSAFVKRFNALLMTSIV